MGPGNQSINEPNLTTEFMANSTNGHDDLALEKSQRFSINVTVSDGSRKSIELSIENTNLVRRASMLLANSAGPQAVLSQADIRRRDKPEHFGINNSGASKTINGRRRRDGIFDARSRSLNLAKSLCEDREKTKHSEDMMDVVVKTRRSSLPLWIVKGRQKLRAVVVEEWFRRLSVFIVVADVLVLALDSEYVTGAALAQLDIAFTILLLTEVVLKVVAFGLWGGKDAYFQRSPYRFLQVFLLIISLVSHCNCASIKWKALRGLKTVRSLTLYSGLRRILKALMRAVPFLANVGSLAMFGLLAFSIFGLEAYGGSYDRQCTISTPEDYTLLYSATSSAASSAPGTIAMEALATIPRVYCSANSSCALSYQMCQAMTPPSRHVNFDSGLSSLFLVFLVVAQDGWVTDIMEPVIESSSFLSVLFFIAIVASMVFLVVNLFVAVITTAFINFTLDEEGEKENPHYMGKLDPVMEETHVNMIMGATLVIEDTISKETNDIDNCTDVTTTDQSGGVGRGGTSNNSAIVQHYAPNSTTPTLLAGTQVGDNKSSRSYKFRPGSAHDCKTVNIKEPNESLLTKMHQWQPLRNLTVETTIHLIQNGVLMQKLFEPLAKSFKNGDVPTKDWTPPPVSRKKALIMGFMSNFDFHASTHALVMQNTAYTNRNFVKLQHFVFSKNFDDFITLCILLNTVCLLAEYLNMNAELKSILSVTEYIFGVIFFLEMTMRIVAMRGLRVYWSSTERIVDMAVVFCTTGDVILKNLETSFSGLSSASSLRILRVTRLMMKYEGTRKLVQSVLKSSRGVMDVVIFMLVFQVVNSIIGMQLFGGSHLVGKDGKVPRWNFDTFVRSFMTLLQVLTGDQWSSITYDAVDAAHPHWLMVPFLILNFIIGQYVLLNLFVAVILENFSITEEEAYQLQLAQIIAIPKELDIYEKIEEVGVRAFGEMDQLENVSNVKLRLILGLDDNKEEAMKTGQPNGDPPNYNNHKVLASLQNGFIRTQAVNQTRKINRQRISAWKRLCRRMVLNIWFSRLVQFMILLSCICLVLDEPHPEMSMSPPSDMFEFALLGLSRIALAVLFMEFVVKVGAFGFGFEYLRVTIFHSDEMLGYRHRQTYMENKWNQLDLALLLLSVVDEIITTVNPTVTLLTTVFRAGRVLRPLRMLNHYNEMKVILNAVARSLPHVGNVLVLCLVIYIIFGVVGRSLFSGKFYFCNDSEVPSAVECVGFFLTYPDGVLPSPEVVARGIPGGAILMPRVWRNARFSFDNIGAGFLALLEMTSLKWIDKAFAAMDIAGVGKQPVTDASAQAAIFFVLYIYAGSLFVIRLFVGVLVEQFQRNNGTGILTESQKSWVDLEKFILLLKPLKSIPRPHMKLQAKLYDICRHPYFSTGISISIMLNLVLLLVSPRSAGGGTSMSLNVIETLFLTIFSLEGLIKCISLRQYYFLQPQGIFEVAILCGSIVAYFFAAGSHRITQAGRIFRMMRVLRFVHLHRGIYTVYQTFRASLRPLGQIFFLMFIIYYIFAIVARQLFGGVRYGPAMNSFSNFRSFESATMLLFQIMSGDDWHLTMTDCMIQKPFCAERISATTGRVYSDCGSVAASALFFITYITLVVFVFLNLFIAVILENFRSCYLKSDVCAVSLLDFEAYREVFLRYDVNNTGYFPMWQLANFLSELPPGLRVIAHRERIAFLQLRSQAQAQWRDGRKRPFFNELLRILCIHQLGIRSLPYEQQRDRVKQIFIYRAQAVEMLLNSYVKGYILRWRLRQAHVAQLALLKVDRATSTCDIFDAGQDEPAKKKSPTKEMETQTECSRDRQRRHHHRHHHQKHRSHSIEPEQQHGSNVLNLSGRDGKAAVSPSLRTVKPYKQHEVVQNAREEANPNLTSQLRPQKPPALPPLVIKRTRDFVVVKSSSQPLT